MWRILDTVLLKTYIRACERYVYVYAHVYAYMYVYVYVYEYVCIYTYICINSQGH